MSDQINSSLVVYIKSMHVYIYRPTVILSVATSKGARNVYEKGKHARWATGQGFC